MCLSAVPMGAAGEKLLEISTMATHLQGQFLLFASLPPQGVVNSHTPSLLNRVLCCSCSVSMIWALGETVKHNMMPSQIRNFSYPADPQRTRPF